MRTAGRYTDDTEKKAGLEWTCDTEQRKIETKPGVQKEWGAIDR